MDLRSGYSIPLLLIILLSGCSQMKPEPPCPEQGTQLSEDNYLWLEEVEGKEALSWAQKQDQKTLAELEIDPRFKLFEQEALSIYEAQDKIAAGQIHDDQLYDFWQDQDHIRGIWRRSPLQAYLDNAPVWEILLDVDALAETEGENWVYKSVAGLPPDFDRFLIELSRGGKDAVVVREFDIPSRSFVIDGFTVPEAKSSVAWISLDQVFVATDFGPGSMTSSGYPATLRVWNRGQTLAASPELARVKSEHVGLWGWSQFFQGGACHLISKSKTFWSHEIWMLSEAGELKRLEIPEDADFKGIWKNDAILLLRSVWGEHTAGAVVAMDLSTHGVQDIFIPDAESAVSEVNMTASSLLLTIQEHVKDKVLSCKPGMEGWLAATLPLPGDGVISIVSASTLNNDFLYSYEDLLSPESLGYFRNADGTPLVIRTTPPRFDATGLVVSQEFTSSKDGTRIPYFLVKQGNLPHDGNNPVLLYGYGGFEVSEKPYYRSTTGKLWLEKGGVFALANIRGGGEYGPAWHQAALTTQRHKSYEDFIAVAEDLITKGITRPEKLGIMGGSGGGLLVGSVYVMRPDLFGAMVCQVPLLDMLRYHKLLAGASWMGEYGDPDDPVEGAYLKRYSPYHNIKPEVKYPRALFTTSTKDDRVHPGHARKMVARLMEQGHPVMYYENIEGGHAAGANFKQSATMAAIEFTYLHRQLGVEP